MNLVSQSQLQQWAEENGVSASPSTAVEQIDLSGLVTHDQLLKARKSK